MISSMKNILDQKLFHKKVYNLYLILFLMKRLEKILLTLFVGAFLSSCPNTTQVQIPSPSPTQTPELKYNYTTTTELAEEQLK